MELLFSCVIRDLRVFVGARELGLITIQHGSLLKLVAGASTEEIQACFQLNADHPRGWRLGTVFSRLGSSEHKVHPRSGCKTE